jgi:peptide/nickel transport system substrate-binding protein
MMFHATRRSGGRRTRAVAALNVGLVAALALSGCTGTTGSTPRSDVVRIVLATEPPTLEPCDITQSTVGMVAATNVAEALTRRNPVTSELEPLLATEWSQTSPTTWTFKLREGVTFHDGSALDAEAVAFSINRLQKEDLDCDVRSQLFQDEVSAKALDASTVEVTTQTVDPILPLRVSFVGIVPKSTSDTAKVRVPVGTGPYVVGEWTNTSLTLTRYDGYWGSAPAYPTAMFTWRDNSNVRTAMVRNGEADLALQISPSDNPGEFGVAYGTREVMYFAIHPWHEPLNDVRVRKAINYALDREGIVAQIMDGLGTPASQMVPEGVVGHNDELEPYPYDLAKAQQLIAEAKADGVDVEAPITIVGRSAWFPQMGQIAEAFQNALIQAGLPNVKVTMLALQGWIVHAVKPFVRDQGAELVLFSHGNQTGDASFTMMQKFLSDGSQSTAVDSQLDAMLKAAAELTGEARANAFKQAIEYEATTVVSTVPILQIEAMIARAPSLDYTPNLSTTDVLELASMKPAS